MSGRRYSHEYRISRELTTPYRSVARLWAEWQAFQEEADPMASDKRKEFLNVGILGGDAGVPERRGFRPINTEYIGSPHYDARFFETFPTAWASAYAFQQALAAEKHTEQGTVVGAYYPDVIFFPSRNRTDWPADKVLSSYLVGPRLSWERCRKDLLSNDKKTGEFHAHLLRIAQLLPSKTFKERVEKFCQS